MDPGGPKKELLPLERFVGRRGGSTVTSADSSGLTLVAELPSASIGVLTRLDIVG